MADWQGVFTAVVLFGAPAVAAVALWRGALTTGAVLLLVTGVGALGFEGLFHFVVESPDNVAAVDEGTTIFGTTAILSTASDAVLALAGVVLLWRQFQGTSATTSSVSQT